MGCDAMSKDSSQKYNQRGFTLIEVLVSSVILIVAVLAIFAIIAHGSGLNKKQLIRRRVFNELERILEKPQFSYKSPYYSNLTPGTHNLNPVTLDDRGNADTGDDLMGNVWVTVVNETYSHGAITNIPAKRVTAFISWNDEGNTYTENLETIITLVSIH